MCFSIPVKVLKVEKDTALLEGGKVVKIGKDFKISAGEYLQIVGNVAVGKLTKGEGLKIRQFIKKLN
jgi:hydrogenase maturation factor